MSSESIDSTSPSPVANPGHIRPPRIFLAAIVLGLVAHFFWPVHLLPSVIGRPVGAVMIVAGIGLFVAASRAFKAAGTPVPGNQPATTIVGTGPYRFSRNPIYLSFALLHFGVALLVNSLAVLITLLPALGVMAFVVIPREERYLTRRFPTEYAAYKASTRRWI